MSMNLIIGPRCSGKTTSLIQVSADTGVPIIAPTMMMANYIKQKAKEYGLDIPEPTSINKVVNQGGKPGKYLIDELEMCLRQLGIDAECVVICAKDEEGGIDGEPVLS